jgi:hypothetical protein
VHPIRKLAAPYLLLDVHLPCKKVEINRAV